MVGVHVAQPRGWLRLRAWFMLTFVIAGVLPYLFRLATLQDWHTLSQVNYSFLGSTFSIALGLWLMRNLATYPGVETTAHVLPVFSISYAVLISALLIGRWPYSLVVLGAGFVLSVIVALIYTNRIRRLRRMRIGVLPFGTAILAVEHPQIDWVIVSSTEMSIDDLDAVTTDLRIDLPSEWDRRLADYALAGLPVYHVKHLAESITGRVELEHLSENTFGTLSPASAYMSIKHTIDWISAAAAGIFLLPVLLLVGLTIRVTSPGPALFRQRRIGYRGVPFTVYKFRTMAVASQDGDSAKHAAITQPNDIRVTRLGRFLRKTRVDELPQILNVLRGEMSWIGPRPEAQILSEWYEAELPFYKYRHIVRPGLAGWAQVSQGHVAEIDDVRLKLHYDFYYIKQFSPWIDLLIIARTMRTVVNGFGAR